MLKTFIYILNGLAAIFLLVMLFTFMIDGDLGKKSDDANVLATIFFISILSSYLLSLKYTKD
jgi:hypothetical protein